MCLGCHSVATYAHTRLQSNTSWTAKRKYAPTTNEKEKSMHRLLRATVLAALIGTLSGIHVFSQGTDPIVGTWVLNVAKSKYSPGPAPKSETRTYVVAGADIKATSKGIDSEGKPTTGEWTINYDGKDRPQTGNPDADTLSLKRIDPSTTEFTQKKGGKVVITGTRTTSKDGKMMTITTKGTNAKGQTVNDVEVFEKR
jgi:hypothetical protein